MTTIQEAFADRFLNPKSNPNVAEEEVNAYYADLMQRSYANPKYGNEGLALTNGENASDSNGFRGGIPSKSQNRIRSGRSGRKAARSQQVLQAVGGLTYKGPWDALKASSKPADYKLCRLKGEEGTGTKKRVAGSSETPSRTTRSATTKATPTKATPAKAPVRSSLLSAVTAQFLEPKVQS